MSNGRATAGPTRREKAWWREEWFLALLLAGGTLLAYLPATRGGYIWDDDEYVTQNPLLAARDGLERIWFSSDVPSQYFPLTYTVLRAERAIWGLNPTGYHCVNILLHTLNALFVWQLLQRLKVSGAWFAALCWALHPVQVESVAWITELKNVLMGCFFLLALRLWVEFSEADEDRRWPFYAGSLACYTLALFAKTTACTLPAALFLVLWLKRQPVTRWRWLQMGPYVLLGLGMGLVSIMWERHHQGTRGALFSIEPLDRVLIPARGVWFYLGKLIWPVNLSFSYPRWQVSATEPACYAGLLALGAAGTAMLWLRRRTGRGPEVALVFFVATLSPVLGFIMLYTFRYSFVADHYQYLACIGPIALTAAGLSRAGSLAASQQSLRRSRLKPGYQQAIGGRAVLAVLAVLLGVLTWRQTAIYRDAETLWRDTVKKNPFSYLAQNSLGNILEMQGRLAEAMACYQRVVQLDPVPAESQINIGAVLVKQGKKAEAAERFERALQLNPAMAEAHYNLGSVLLADGKSGEAIQHFEQALVLRPGFAEAHANLGAALEGKGQINRAISEYRQALRLNPGYVEVHDNLGAALVKKGDLDGAILQFQEALRLKPDDPLAQDSLGTLLDKKGDIDAAIRIYQQSIRARPEHVEAHDDLGAALVKKGEIDGAMLQFREALRLKPDDPCAHNGLGTVLNKMGNIDEAVSEYQEALRLKPDYVEAHDDLGAALGRKGDLDGAILQFQEALRLKPDDPYAHNGLGTALYAAGDMDGAILQLQEARRLQPDSFATLYNLGAALERKGRTSAALEQFQAALRLKPDSVEISNLISRLESKVAAAER